MNYRIFIFSLFATAVLFIWDIKALALYGSGYLLGEMLFFLFPEEGLE